MASTSWYDVALNQRKYLSQSLPSLFLFSDTDDEDYEDYEISEEDEIDGPGSQENGESSPYFNYKFAPISSITMETSVSSTEDKSTWKNNKAGAWGEEHVENTSVYTHSPVPDIRIIEDNYVSIMHCLLIYLLQVHVIYCRILQVHVIYYGILQVHVIYCVILQVHACNLL